MFRMPNIREDLRALPEMFRTRKLLWTPFVLLFVTFVGRAALDPGRPADATWAGSCRWPCELLLRPTGLFIFFIGGFLAPRGELPRGCHPGHHRRHPVGRCWASWCLARRSALDGTVQTTTPLTFADAVVFVMVAIVVGILAASFAAWYRNFLRSSQERARQNRVAT